MAKGPKHAGQNAARNPKAGWRKKTSVNSAASKASPGERAAYWSAKRAGQLEIKKVKKEDRAKKRAAARKAAKQNFAGSRAGK